MKTKNIMETINSLSRGAALCEHNCYVFHRDDDPSNPAQLLVDIVAWRTSSQGHEYEKWSDLSDLLIAIEDLPGVAFLNQIGDIDHENGRGWTYEVTLA
jgi:hypothetical protein